MVTSLSPPGRRAAELKGSIQFPHPQPTRADSLTVTLVAVGRDMCSLKKPTHTASSPYTHTHTHTLTLTDNPVHTHTHTHLSHNLYIRSHFSFHFHACMKCIWPLRYPHSGCAQFEARPCALTARQCAFARCNLLVRARVFSFFSANRGESNS